MKQINFSYKDVDYTLEFTRRTIRELEAKGFNPADIEKKPMTTIPELFAGAFLAHHKGTKRELIDEIFSHIKDRETLLGKLSEMYAEPLTALIDDSEQGNVSWEASW